MTDDSGPFLTETGMAKEIILLRTRVVELESQGRALADIAKQTMAQKAELERAARALVESCSGLHEGVSKKPSWDTVVAVRSAIQYAPLACTENCVQNGYPVQDCPKHGDGQGLASECEGNAMTGNWCPSCGHAGEDHAVTCSACDHMDDCGHVPGYIKGRVSELEQRTRILESALFDLLECHEDEPDRPAVVQATLALCNLGRSGPCPTCGSRYPDG